MENTLPFTFERSLWREAARLKREHPELLEAKTEERRKRNGKTAGKPGRLESLSILRK